MTSSIRPASLETSAFAGTAPYYHRYRAPYAQAAFDFIANQCGLDESVRGLDLGCGPGTTAIPLSQVVGEVVAVDSDSDMIVEAQRIAAGRGRDNIQWLRSRAEAISADLGVFQVATIGQAFHWMDRDEMLRLLGCS